MKLKRIQVRNFMGVREIDIVPKDVNLINGRNRQGKTSLIRAIEAAFQGGDQTAKIRKGESSAEILIELDNLYVSRNINLGEKSTLTVVDQNGEIQKSPQGVLDGIVGGFSFNPAEFFMMDSKKQREYLLESLPMKLAPDDITEWTRRAIPSDFSPQAFVSLHGLVLLQRITRWYYDARTDVNREVDRLLKAGQEQGKLVPPDFDLESYDPNGLQALYEQVRKAEANNNRIATLNSTKQRVNAEILELERKLKMLRGTLETTEAELNTLQPIDVTGLEQQIASHEETRAIAQAAEKLVVLRAQYAEQRKEQQDLDRIVSVLRKDAVDELASRVSWPVTDMEVTEDGLLFNGKPYELLSGAEQIDVSLKIANALNGEFNIVCVDGVERLDNESFAEFVKQMEEDEITQYFITAVGDRVADGAEVFTIEDGRVAQPTDGKSNGKAKKKGAQ